MRLEVVIVSYRSRDLLRACLATLRGHAVTVVDNDSRDGTLEMVREEFPDVRLIANDANAGFGRANNQAIRGGDSTYVLALNPDTRVTEGALDRLLDLMDERPEIGICGCRLELEDGSFDHAAKRSFPTVLGALGHFAGAETQYRAPDVVEGPVDAVNGAFMLMRRSVLDEIGLFDEGYWMFMEDLDLCYRCRQAGHLVWYEPSVTVVHVKHGSHAEGRSPRLDYAFHQGMARFYRKHYAVSRNALANAAVYAGIWGKFGISLARGAFRRSGRRPKDRPVADLSGPGEGPSSSEGMKATAGSEKIPGWPNLFLVGAAKAATTSLWRHLGEHPEIYMSPVKEPNFFSDTKHRLVPTISDERAYLELFADAAGARVRGEASQYLWNETALERIRTVSPDSKILISLREPIERAYAEYWHRVTFGGEQRSFDDAVSEELERYEREGWARYFSRSLYSDAVERWFLAFPGAVHVVVFEEFVQDVSKHLATIFEFLGVAPHSHAAQAVAHNPFVLPRTPTSGRVLSSRVAHSVGRILVPQSIRPRVSRALTTRVAKPVMQPAVRERLTAFYLADVRKLEDVLGRGLPWTSFRR